MLPNPWLILGACAAALGLYLLGQADGRADARAEADRDKVAALTRLIAEQADLAAQDREVLSADVGRQARVAKQFDIIDREVSRYALFHRDSPPCLDPDGLRAWRAAARGDAAEIAAAQPGIDYRISGDPAGAGERLGSGPAGQLLGGGPALPPAAGQVREPGRVGHESKPPHWGWD